jgi:uncharacterized protein YkwD
MKNSRTQVPAVLCVLITLAMLALVGPAAAQARRCIGADHVPANSGAGAQARHATLCLLNRQRAGHGLRSLRSRGSLRSAATSYSWQMVRENFFDHVSPDGRTLTDRVKATRYLRGQWPRFSLAENIGYGDGPLGTPRSIVAAWMRSAGHRANILDGRYRDIGLGIVPGMPGRNGVGATYTTDFGFRAH